VQFNHNNDIDLICRAHQLVMEGYKYHFPARNLVTVWSAPNYCYRCGNVASVLAIDDHLNRDFKLFTEVPEATDLHNRNLVPYFL
jgi:serine/threonine-protein phosphatase 6 catalytic subunit